MRRRVVPGRPAPGRGPSGAVALVSMGPQVPTHTYRPRPRGARLAANRVIAAVLCLVLACGAWALLRPDPAPSAAVLSARLADASHRVLRDGDARQAQRLAAAALTARDTPEARSAAMAALAAPLHASTSAPAGDDGAELVARSGDTVATGARPASCACGGCRTSRSGTASRSRRWADPCRARTGGSRRSR